MMGLGQDSQRVIPMWLKTGWLIGTAIALLSPTFSNAQEVTRPAAPPASTAPEASQVQRTQGTPRLFEDQLLPTENVGGISAVGRALAKLNAASPNPNDQSIKKHLHYTVMIVELPFNKAESATENWKIMGAVSNDVQESSSDSVSNSEVVLASHASTSIRSEFRVSDVLNEEQVELLVSTGTLVSRPKLLGENGEEVSMRVGREMPYVASFEPLKDENGKDADTMQPKIETIHEGIKLSLTGTLDDDKKNVLLRVNFVRSELKHLDTFSFDLEDGPVTVQQPRVAASRIDTTCRAPLNKTIALCGGPIQRDVIVQREAPLIKYIPYVGRLFKNTSKATESISTIILIRCHEQLDANLRSKELEPGT